MVDCKEKNRIKYDDFLKKEILIIYMLNLGKTNNQILPKILNFRDIIQISTGFIQHKNFHFLSSIKNLAKPLPK